MTKFVAQHGGTNPREVVNTKEKIIGKSSQLSLKHEEKETIILHQIQTVSQIHKNKMKVWLLLLFPLSLLIFHIKGNAKFEVGNETRAYIKLIHLHSFENGSLVRGCCRIKFH